MQFLNAQEGWLGAEIGQILRTTDGGKTWKIQKTGTTDKLITDLHFINSQEGWAVAPQRRDGGFILHTVNGGEYWKIQAKTNQPGIAVHFADETRGWVILGNGNSLLTEDGGETWTLRTPNESPQRLRRITFRSHAHAWGVGGGGAFITEDQGVTWKAVPVSAGDEQLAMQQPEAETPTEPAAPEDATPETDEDPAEAFRNRLRQLRQRAGQLAPEGEIPTDSNQVQPNTTQTQEPPPPRQPRRRRRGGVSIANVYFLNSQQAWAAGGAGSIYHTEDGGKTWKRQLGEQQRNNFREVLFYDDNTGWIADDNGTLLETQDAGKTWKQLRQARQRLIGIHFASLDPKWGWTMQRNGTLLYTTDGNTWTSGDTPERPPLFEDDPPETFMLNDVAFGKFSEGWAVGRYGDIIHNKDGGPVWKLQRTTVNDSLTSVDMKFAPLGWAVGEGGVTQRTINGGDYWRLHPTGIWSALNDVSFISKRKGWAAGESGIVIKTIDGGFTWKPVSTGVTATLYAIVALSEKEIYAVGEQGLILHSADGGETWQQEHTDIDNDLYVITRAKEGKTLWVVGQWGVVLRRKLESPAEVSM